MATKIETQIAAARQAGHSDLEIFKAISKSPKYAFGFEKARASGLSNIDIAKDLGLLISQKDLGAMPAIKQYVAPDLNEERKQNMRKAAKESGPRYYARRSLYW